MNNNELYIEKIMTSLISYWNPKEYFNYSSNVDRLSFWIVYFINIVIFSTAYNLAYLFDSQKNYMLVSSIILLLPQLSFVVRRANDGGFKKIFPIVFYCIPSILMIDFYYQYYLNYEIIGEFSKLVAAGNNEDSTVSMIIPFILSVQWLVIPALVTIISFTVFGLKETKKIN